VRAGLALYSKRAFSFHLLLRPWSEAHSDEEEQIEEGRSKASPIK